MATGVPDVLFSIGRVSGWMELKSIKKGTRVSTLTDYQICWLHQGNAWLCVEVRDLDIVYLVRGSIVESQSLNFKHSLVIEFNKENLDQIVKRLVL
jgi:hypothetical protein